MPTHNCDPMFHLVISKGVDLFLCEGPGSLWSFCVFVHLRITPHVQFKAVFVWNRHINECSAGIIP